MEEVRGAPQRKCSRFEYFPAYTVQQPEHFQFFIAALVYLFCRLCTLEHKAQDVYQGTSTVRQRSDGSSTPVLGRSRTFRIW